MGQVQKIIKKFEKNPVYLTNGAGFLSKKWNCSKEDIYIAKKLLKNKKEIANIYTKESEDALINSKLFEDFKTLISATKELKTPKNILIIGDTHIPYEKEGYLEFCKEQYDIYNCDTVIHIGDLIDSHATSRHPSIPDAYSAGDELYYTKKKLRKWYKTFPNMKVVIGNHDIRAYKIASDVGIASKWLKGFADVLEVPNWTFEECYEINDTVFVHGTGTSGVTAAYRRALNLGQNVVIGHLHSEAGILYHKLPDKTMWGMIVGCGVDENSYGMNYAKNIIKKSIISCGVIVDGTPILKVMNS